MSININNFEQHIESKIIDRGFDYYEQDYIQSFEQLEKGEFSAGVSGSDNYSVFIKLNDKYKIVEHNCDCPYDWGDYCKHEVAVLYMIRDSEQHLRPPNGNGNFASLKKEIDSCDDKSFKELILNMAKKDRKLRSELLWEFGYEDEWYNFKKLQAT